MSTQLQQDSQEKHLDSRLGYPVWCCWPPTRAGTSFWGGVLILFGAVWLLHNFGWIAEGWDELLLPLIVIGLGLLYLGEAYLRR